MFTRARSTSWIGAAALVLLGAACSHKRAPGEVKDQADDDTNNPTETGGDNGPSALAVTAVVPANDAVGIAADTIVVITFNEELVPSSVTGRVGLSQATGEAVAFTLGTTGRRVSLTPEAPLKSRTKYLIWADAGIAGTSGIALAARYESTFTTIVKVSQGAQRLMLSPFVGTSRGGGYELSSVGGRGLAGEAQRDNYHLNAEARPTAKAAAPVSKK
jgi:hypothetical protein